MTAIASILDALILAAIVGAVLWRLSAPFVAHEWLEKAALGFVSVAAIFGIREALSPHPLDATAVVMHLGVLAFLTYRILSRPTHHAAGRGHARDGNAKVVEAFRRRAF